jgi:hypothetical protein
MLFIITPNLGFEFSRSFLFVVFGSGANLMVDRKASPEVSLEVEVGCTLFISGGGRLSDGVVVHALGGW